MDSSADALNSAPTRDDLRRYEALLAALRQLGSAVIAFSGGVDSSFLLHAAKEAMGDRVLAVTATSPTYPRSEREEASRLAGSWGVAHRLIQSNELEIPGFSSNQLLMTIPWTRGGAPVPSDACPGPVSVLRWR